MQRRNFVLGIGGMALLPVASANPNLDALTSGLPKRGSGEFRRWGFLVYEATLWAQDDEALNPPLALALTYKRNLDGAKIADASVTEIRQLNIASEAQLKLWGERMTQIFPDVKAADCIVGLHLPSGAKFFYNDRFIGSIDDPAFARAFFAIWLDAKTSAPALRALLLKRAA